MYTKKKRALSLAAAIAICFTAYINPVWATVIETTMFDKIVVPNVGEIQRTQDYQLGGGTYLTQTTLRDTNNAPQEERFVTWQPGYGVTPLVVASSSLHGTGTTIAQAEAALKVKGVVPVAGINGDYFDMSTGVPNGIMVTDGVLRCYEPNHNYIAFPKSGSPYISRTDLTIQASALINGTENIFFIDQLNHPLLRARLSLFTHDYAATTKVSVDSTQVVLNVKGGLTVGEPVETTVAKVVTGKTAVSLQAGQMVLVSDALGPIGRISNLAEGMAITLSVSCSDERFKTVTQAIGGFQKLLTNGTVPSLEAGTSPRTAVGIKADGTCVLYTVDGRQTGYSSGMTLTQMANRLLSLGCVEALNLDGGGSTIISANYPGFPSMEVANVPSDGSPRKVANYLFLVNSAPKTNVASRLFVYPEMSSVLINSRVSFKVYATDENIHTMPTPANLSWSGSDSVGSVQSGVFTALSPGISEITVSAGQAVGNAYIRVVETLDSVSIVKEISGSALASLSAVPGDSVDLKAIGTYQGDSVISQDSSFIWSVSGNIGTITQEGVFTASNIIGASGAIVVLYGSSAYSLPVTVGRMPETVETFEQNSMAFTEGGDSISFAYTKETDYVRYGLQAGEIQYSFAASGAEATSLSLPMPLTIPAGNRYLNLWIYGDNSGNMVSLSLSDSSGNIVDLNVCTLDYSGYRIQHVTLPSGVTSVKAFRVLQLTNAKTSGTLYTDQWTTSYELSDTIIPPMMTLDLVDTESEPGFLLLKATVTNSAGAPLNRNAITLLWDTAPQSVSYDSYTGQLNARVTLTDTLFHRLTLEAVDPYGNRTRRTRNIIRTGETANESNYFDVVSEYGPHWGKDYIDYLDRLDVVSGIDRMGILYFEPNKALTRLDATIYMSKALGVNVDQYASVALPFEDMNSIPQESLNAVKAMYAMDILKGRSYEDKLYFDGDKNLTRAEFVTILGRTLPKGYLLSPLAFDDADSIPAYALPHVRLMVSLDIISGDDNNKFRPFDNISRAEACKVLSMLQ